MEVKVEVIKKVLEKIFYSNLFKQLRIKNYKDAYEQGRFDTEMDILLAMEIGGSNETNQNGEGDNYKI